LRFGASEGDKEPVEEAVEDVGEEGGEKVAMGGRERYVGREVEDMAESALPGRD
jgi:hypothetical protein